MEKADESLYRLYRKDLQDGVGEILEANGESLNYANYFKNQSYMSQLFTKALDGEIKRCSREVFKDLS
jgi:hypothetical protein